MATRKTKSKTKPVTESKFTLYSFRLTDADVARLDRVQKQYGVQTRSAALRIAIKRGARREVTP